MTLGGRADPPLESRKFEENPLAEVVIRPAFVPLGSGVRGVRRTEGLTVEQHPLEKLPPLGVELRDGRLQDEDDLGLLVED